MSDIDNAIVHHPIDAAAGELAKERGIAVVAYTPFGQSGKPFEKRARLAITIELKAPKERRRRRHRPPPLRQRGRPRITQRRIQPVEVVE